MKKWLALYVSLCLACGAMYVVGRENPTNLQRAVENGELLRIHILAHDDTPQQQELKLQVRDAILEAFTPMFSQAENAQDAAAMVQDNMDDAVRIAVETVRRAGFALPVYAEFGVFDFPERIYGGQVVPAGAYTALRIGLGEAKGKNWWCVMYPPLCFSGEDYEGEIRFESDILKWIRKWKQERTKNNPHGEDAMRGNGFE